ncbi:MAG TPA: hypothetical protein VK590_15165 [Saprospiraceae bacterium]|nr:hypothetical protein [Saprospiraceae bacterium]
MKKLFQFIIMTVLISVTANKLSAQFAYFLPNPPNVEDSLTLYVDVTQDPTCKKLVNDQNDIYIWRWLPKNPAIDNGTWGASLDELKMTRVSDNLFAYKAKLTDFYGVPAKQLYTDGIFFLAKEKNGGMGGDCSESGAEFKTSDIHLDIPAPVGTVAKVLSYPAVVDNDTLYTRPSDVFTIIYNNFVEDKPTMLNVNNMSLFPKVVGSDGKLYTPIVPAQIKNHPELEMKLVGSGVWQFSMIPEMFFKNYLPAGVVPKILRIQLVNLPFTTTDNSVDGEFIFKFKCDN